MIRDIQIDRDIWDWSINLPSWAYREGYTLRGKCGTYDYLELWKDWNLLQKFSWNRIPNIFEIEEVIMESEICKDCGHYKVLNKRHIEGGKPKKFCDLGEHPGYCRLEKNFGSTRK